MTDRELLLMQEARASQAPRPMPSRPDSVVDRLRQAQKQIDDYTMYGSDSVPGVWRNVPPHKYNDETRESNNPLDRVAGGSSYGLSDRPIVPEPVFQVPAVPTPDYQTAIAPNITGQSSYDFSMPLRSRPQLPPTEQYSENPPATIGGGKYRGWPQQPEPNLALPPVAMPRVNRSGREENAYYNTVDTKEAGRRWSRGAPIYGASTVRDLSDPLSGGNYSKAYSEGVSDRKSTRLNSSHVA